MACENDWAISRIDHLECQGILIGIDVLLAVRDWKRGINVAIKFAGGLLGVFRYIDEYRAGSSTACEVECGPEGRSYVLGSLHEVVARRMLARSRRRDIRRRVLRLHRSSIPTGPAHLFSLLIHFLAAQIVIAPREADETSLAYFAITPVTYLGFGGVQEDNRRFNSES